MSDNWILDEKVGLYSHRTFDLSVVRVMSENRQERWVYFAGDYESPQFASPEEALEESISYMSIGKLTDEIREETYRKGLLYEFESVEGQSGDLLKKFLNEVVDYFEGAAVETGEGILGANRKIARRAIRKLKELRREDRKAL